MKYVPPIGAADNAPYLDGNPSTGVEGSPVPAAAIEHPMREILAVIQAAGLTPNANLLDQLLQAIRTVAGNAASNAVNDGLNGVDLSALANALNGKANKSGDTFAGNVFGPTAAAGTTTTQLATTAFVAAGLAGKASSEAKGITTATLADVTTDATTDTAAFAATGYTFPNLLIALWRKINGLFTTKANLASPTFTGVPAGPTAAAGTKTTQLATTAFVAALASQGGIVAQSLGASGYIRFGNGLTLQWMQLVVGNFTWPLAFSTLYIAGVTGQRGYYNHLPTCNNIGGVAEGGADDIYAIGIIN